MRHRRRRVRPFDDASGTRVERLLGGAVAGFLAGVVAGLPLLSRVMAGTGPAWSAGDAVVFLGYGTVAGAAVGIVVGYRHRGLAASASGGLLVGLLGWIVAYLTVGPVLSGQRPTWSAASAGEHFPELVGALLHGGLAGALVNGLLAVRRRTARGGPADAALPESGPRRAPRVVVIGGGFGGVAAAQRFERYLAAGRPLDVTLVSASNFLLFTPMLAEAASGAVQASHISTPLRAACPHTTVRRATVTGIDTARRVVHLVTGGRADDPAARETVPYDHAVVAVGAVPNFFDLPGVAEHAFTLKSLDDAVRLRNHVLSLLEHADLETDRQRRRSMLTFVVAGGGFAGTETVAELYDLVHGVLHYYPGIHPDEPRFVLVHAGDRILPELSGELGDFALGRLRRRGIEFRLGNRVAAAGVEQVELTDGSRLATRTLVWTAGNRPHPVVAGLPAAGKGGALAVEATLQVVGEQRLWAVGDCARIPDPDSDGGSYPPTAQHALREGRAVADNIVAVLDGRQPTRFRFRTLGVFVALGHRTAAGEIRGRRFSGLAAWFLWRGIYLGKLPGLEKKLRVLVDWLLDLAFPRDIVVTDPADQAAVADAPPAWAGSSRQEAR